MTPLQRRFIELYATAQSSQVHATAGYQQLLAAAASEPGFHAARILVNRLRDYADEWLGPRSSDREQVEFALRFMRKLRTEIEYELWRELILKSYAAKWAEEKHRTYFADKSLFITAAKHYFLSFTSRNPLKPDLNQVNRNHRHFIIDALGLKRYESADLSGQNLVAEAIHYYLRNNQRDGFFFPLHQEDNSEVEKKLRTNCEKSLSFVQLIQAEMFRYDEQRRNWCHFEYDVATAHGADRMLFVKLDPQIPDSEIYWQFDGWYKEFAKRDSLVLEPTREAEPKVIDRNFARISDKLTGLISDSIDRFYKEIPQ